MTISVTGIFNKYSLALTPQLLPLKKLEVMLLDKAVSELQKTFWGFCRVGFCCEDSVVRVPLVVTE